MGVSFPITSAPSRAATPDSTPIRASGWPKVLFWILIACLLPLMVKASFDFGVTWDENNRHKNGVAILEYFRGNVPRELAHYGTMYPGFFDVIPAWLERRYDIDRYVVRHRVNAVFGWIGILFTGLLAGRLFGPWSGILAVILLAASPRYFAHSMNNPKDLPFAAMSVMVLYCLSRLSTRWPYLTVGTGAALAVALGLALGTRPGALLYFGYLPLLVVAMLIGQRISAVPTADRGEVRRGLKSLLTIPRVHWTAGVQLIARVSLVIVAGLLVGSVFWPWAQAEPFTRPFEALSKAGAYDWAGQLLFKGRLLHPEELPWSYLPTWFLITTPPVVLAGMVLSVLAYVRGWGWPRVALWGVALLPIVLIIVRDSPVYDGMRHVLFAYPPMVVVAASGWTALLRLRPRWRQIGGFALLIAGLVNVLAYNVRSYPNQAAYINELAGGPKGAFAWYELDYWGNCVLQAVKWSAAQARQAQMPVRVWGRPEQVEHDTERFPELIFTREGEDPHHLKIRLLRGSVRDLWGLANHPDVVHRVTTTDGAVLCVVSRGTYPDFEELLRRQQAFGSPPSR